MKLFLDSCLKDKFDICFQKTNFRSSNANKAKIGATSLMWTAVFHIKLFYHLIFFRPSVVYYPITPTAVGWLGRDIPCIVICSLFRRRIVIHLRGSHLKLNFAKFPSLVRKLARFAGKRVTVAIVQAECLRDQFEGLVPNDRIRVLPQAIDCAEFDSANDTPSTNGPEPSLLFLGNLSYAKGYCDLVDALPAVAEAVPDVKFIFCGSMIEGPTGVYFDQTTGQPLNHSSPQRAHEEIIRSKYNRNYEWRGVVSGKEKSILLESCSIVALPSYSEGFSRALLEAVTAGKPIIYTPVGAHKEFFRDGTNGLMSAPGDIDGLSAAITKLLLDEQLRTQIGANNYAYARERFDIAAISAQLAEILEEAMNA